MSVPIKMFWGSFLGVDEAWSSLERERLCVLLLE